MRMFRQGVIHQALFASAIALPAMLLATEPTVAQVIYRQWSYFGEPYARYGNPYMRPPALIRPVPLPPGEIIDIMADNYRYRRVGQPQFAGHMYVVDGIDRTGAIVRSYVDAYNGRLIDVDVLQPAGRQIGPGPRIARLPETDEKPRVSPAPPRRPTDARPTDARPTDARPSETSPADARPPRRQAARPPVATSAAPDAALPTTTTRPSATPIVPLSREPRVVNPSEVRLPEEADKAPPMARPTQRAPAPATNPAPALVPPEPQSAAPAPAVVPRASAPPPAPARPAPGSSQVAPAPLDDAARRPAAPATPSVPAAPLL